MILGYYALLGRGTSTLQVPRNRDGVVEGSSGPRLQRFLVPGDLDDPDPDPNSQVVCIGIQILASSQGSQMLHVVSLYFMWYWQ